MEAKPRHGCGAEVGQKLKNLPPIGDLLVSNSDEFNPDPNQPSEIVEFTVQGQFVGEISVDANPGGAFGLKASKVIGNIYHFAAVDDNANTITIWTLNAGH
jgi:hypothetical protein